MEKIESAYKNFGKSDSIDVVVDRFYEGKQLVTALILPVRESDIGAKNERGKLYERCKREFGKLAVVEQDSFGKYVVLRVGRSAKKLDLGKNVSQTVMSFDYRISEDIKGKMVKLARAVSLEKMYSLFPDVPKLSVSAIYSLTHMGVYDDKHKRPLTDADRSRIARFTKQGKDYKWIGQKIKLNPFQVIAYQAVLTRRKK